MSNKDDINLKVKKIKKSKKSFLSLIASAIATAVSAPDAQSKDYVAPPTKTDPILVPTAPIAKPPTWDPVEEASPVIDYSPY